MLFISCIVAGGRPPRLMPDQTVMGSLAAASRICTSNAPVCQGASNERNKEVSDTKARRNRC